MMTDIASYSYAGDIMRSLAAVSRGLTKTLICSHRKSDSPLLVARVQFPRIYGTRVYTASAPIANFFLTHPFCFELSQVHAN